MAKTVALSAADLTPEKPRSQSSVQQHGSLPSSELVPLQFRMPPEFVRTFKQAALDRDMKLNELLNTCFNEFMKIFDAARTPFQLERVGEVSKVRSVPSLAA